MRNQFRKVKVFVASPGDVIEERECAANAVREISNYLESDGLILEPVRWETHAWPSFGVDAQEVINQQIGEYDIFVGIMWKRFGTPTGRSASGTVEEFDRAYEHWKTYGRPHLMFYFRQAPFVPKKSDLEQVRRVLAFKDRLKAEALVWEYEDTDAFESLFRKHLMHHFRQQAPEPVHAEPNERTTRSQTAASTSADLSTPTQQTTADAAAPLAQQPPDAQRVNLVPVNFLISELVMPLAQRLGDGWIDAKAEVINARLRELLKELVAAISTSDPELDSVVAGLRRYVQHDPAGAAQLTEAARRPEVTVESGADQAMKKIERFRALLVFVFDRVARLERPVALPGFFNCTSCVTVIDARSEDGILLPASPSDRSWADPLPWIVLTALENPVGDAVQSGAPRVWIIRSESDDRRDTLVSELDARFSRPQRLLSSPIVFEFDLSDHPAELVQSIEADWVNIVRRPLAASDNLVEMVKGALETSDRDDYYAITELAGIKLLRDRLEELLKERWDADEEWR